MEYKISVKNQEGDELDNFSIEADSVKEAIDKAIVEHNLEYVDHADNPPDITLVVHQDVPISEDGEMFEILQILQKEFPNTEFKGLHIPQDYTGIHGSNHNTGDRIVFSVGDTGYGIIAWDGSQYVSTLPSKEATGIPLLENDDLPTVGFESRDEEEEYADLIAHLRSIGC